MVDPIHFNLVNPVIPVFQDTLKQDETLTETVVVKEIIESISPKTLNPDNPKKLETETEEEEDVFEDSLDHIDDTFLTEQHVPRNTVENDDDEEYFECEDETTPQKQPVVADEEPLSYYYVENEQGGITPRWLHWADKVASFSESIIGNKLVQTGKAMIGENVGMLVGAAFPEASIAYAVGKSTASKYVGESENKSMIVEGAAITAALTATALSKGLEYLTGTPMEYGRALGYMVTASGTIAGGMNGLQTMGQEVPEGYIPRTAAYLVTTGVVGSTVSTVNSVVNSVPLLPTPLSTTIAVTGGILKTVSGTAAYYAPETVNLADKIMHPKLKPGNLYDPGTFVQYVAKSAHGSSDAVSTAMSKKLIESPLLASIVQVLMKHTIDKKVATNALVRALNDFAGIIQDPSIQQKFKDYKTSPTEKNKEILKTAIEQLVESKYGFIEKRIAGVVRKNSDPLVPKLVNQFVDILSKKETEFFSMELSDSKQTHNLLELLLPALIPFIGVYAKRELGSSKDLTPGEVEKFYLTINDVLFAPYNDYMLARGVQGLISTAIPVMQQKAQFIPGLLSEVVGQSMVDPIITLDDDDEFNIPVKEKKTVEEPTPKLSMWESIRQKIRTIKYIYLLIGPKRFFKAVGQYLINYFRGKKSKGSDVVIPKTNPITKKPGATD